MSFVEYVAKEGERWDWVAFQAYGDPYLYEGIIRANPHLLGVRSLAGGTVLRVPVLEEADTTPSIPPEQLPPWKR